MKTNTSIDGHTPGPWSFAPAATIVGADGRRICQMRVRLDASDLADAHLVVVAPELLIALYQYRDDLRYPPAPDSIERRLAMINALIAKAGGQP